MDLLKRIRRALSGSTIGERAVSADLYPIQVRCQRCGEILSAQINLRNDLSRDYERNVYFVRKLIIGSGANRCFQRVEVELTFDQERRLIDRQISGGTFVDTQT